MGLRDSDEDLRETFDDALRAMKEDGTLTTLILKWFGEDAQTY